MISQIALTPIFGLPAIMYGGLLTFLCILFTASIGLMNFKGITIIPFKWHPIMAITTITIAIIHGILGMSIIFGF